MSADLGFRVSYLRVRFSFITVSFGLFVFLVGAKPNWFGWDRSPVVGFVQIAVFMIGLALICIGGYIGLVAMWGNEQRSITADIGLRLVGTGFVIAIFTGMADIVGLGSQPLPNVPYFGPWQAGGVVISQLIIALGFLMTIPYHLLIKGKE
jgi:hypothetical protein